MCRFLNRITQFWASLVNLSKSFVLFGAFSAFVATTVATATAVAMAVMASFHVMCLCVTFFSACKRRDKDDICIHNVSDSHFFWDLDCLFLVYLAFWLVLVHGNGEK